MFDFEKLDVYQHIKILNTKILKLLSEENDFDEHLKEIWKKSTLNSILNLTEVSGRVSTDEKLKFLAVSRGSIFESVAILDILFNMKKIDKELFKELYFDYEKASKMLLGMFKSIARKDEMTFHKTQNFTT